MPSFALSASAQRRLDELCDAWAVKYTDRWFERPGLAQARWPSLETGKQWRTTYEIDADEVVDTADLLENAILTLAPLHREALWAWAVANHYNRGLVRKATRTATGVTYQMFRSPRGSEEAVAAAKEALARVLVRFNVEL